MAYTNIDDSSVHFQTALYTGLGTAKSVTNDGNSNLKPDLIWFKNRPSTVSHAFYDTNRGVNKFLALDQNTSAETTTASGYELTSFDTNGFSLGLNQFGTNNQDNTQYYAAWQWKANGGTTASNTDGGITTTVQANTDAGFSIVTYTGTGSSNTIGHGLGVAPDMMIVKNRSGAYNWAVYHKDSNSSPEDYYAQLNTNNAFSLATDIFGTSSATSSVIGVKNFNETNASGSNYVAYCFAEKQGYSQFGSYVGNGSPNGMCVYTSFKPAFIMVKKSNSTGGWVINDSKRIGHNPNNYDLYANANSAEEDNDRFDLLSNGFKARSTSSPSNSVGAIYIYMAFAENPFVTSTGIPTTAR